MEPSPTLCYNNGPLDRAAHHRKDAAWLAAASASGAARAVVLRQDQQWFAAPGPAGSDPAPQGLLAATPALMQAAGEVVFLGLLEEQPVFALDFSALELPVATRLLGSGHFAGLRQRAPLLRPALAALGAYARSLLLWHAGQRYCGACGTSTRSEEAGHVRRCPNAACQRLHYPRTDPAVIVLLECRDQAEPACLLNRVQTPTGYLVSTLAGFVEPGESLEDTVRREMLEEVGLAVTHITYQASQAWPFPASLMLGFTAQSHTRAFRPDQEEITDAAWYTAAELRQQVQAGAISLSRPDSIARFLLESWIARHG